MVISAFTTTLMMVGILTFPISWKGTLQQYAGRLHRLLKPRLITERLDLEQLEVRGQPVQVLESVSTHEFDSARFALSREGTLVYVPGETDRTSKATNEKSFKMLSANEWFPSHAGIDCGVR